MDWDISPSAEAVGDQLRIVPVGPRLSVPSSIAEHLDDPDYTFLTADELALSRDGEGEWNTEFAEVANGLLAYERCGAHAGNTRWPQGLTWFSLFLRVYLVPESPQTLADRITCLGPALAETVGGLEPQVVTTVEGGWLRSRLSFRLVFDDYNGTAVLDFSMRDYCESTAVLLFMYALEQPDNPELDILATADSTCLVAADETECCLP